MGMRIDLIWMGMRIGFGLGCELPLDGDEDWAEMFYIMLCQFH